MPEPLVAVVGRPNVGKSTLVNRIVGRREAIVEEQPGVTRDRKIVEADWNGRDFLVVDTGGWMATQDGIDAQVSRQAERAIKEADVVLLVVDATVGVTEEDDRVAGLLRRAGKPVVAVANKVDDSWRE
ncbi:MAG: 50S ribosome-binding GTPase, partial [Acidimicrobiia bacterium]|nr:50S ribosome-binding GTPase [Acidimicrobiia bacterium]